MLAETRKLPHVAASHGLWHQRFTYALAFLPCLPTVATPDELGLIFGGIQILVKNPYMPPGDATVDILLQRFEALPGSERAETRTIIELLISHYRLSPHPFYQTRRKAYHNAVLKLVLTLRKIVTGRHSIPNLLHIEQENTL